MSYTYRDRERDWDETRPVSIKRYVISPEDDRREDRRDFMSRHDDSFGGERELVIRRKTDREEPVTVSRYEREVEYEPPTRYERDYYDPRTSYTSPRESEYDVVRRSEADEDPYYYHRHRRVREYDDHRSRRELSPDDSVSQTSRRRRGDRDQDYSSDDSMVYIRKETRDYDDHPHHRRHMAEGALVGAGAAELFRSHSKKDDEASHGASRIGKTVGAGALGAVAVNAASRAREYYHRSKSRHRADSFEDDRSSHRHNRHSRSRHSRNCSRSHSHSRAKTRLELGVGSAAVAAGVAALRSKSKAGDSKGRSRTRSRCRAISRGRSGQDREQGERSRSTSPLKQALPIVGAGLATAAATGLYENSKSQEDEKDASSRGQRRSRSRCVTSSRFYPDSSRDPTGLIEYGVDPVAGSIPDEHYYRQPVSPSVPYDASDTYGRRSTRNRNRSRIREVRYSSSSGSDREDRPGYGSKKCRSRSPEISSAALDVTGLGYTAQKYSQHKDRRKSEERERSRNKERKEEVSRKRLRSCSDNDDVPRGRTRTRFDQNSISHTVSDAGKTARWDGQSEEEGSSHKFRRMNSNSPWRKLEKGAEHDKVNEDATLTPKTAKKDISLPSAIDRAMEETLEGLVLQWTNLTREEIEIE